MTLHATHPEPWCADCPTCRETLDPGIRACSCQSGWPKPRPLWRRLLDALRRMR